MRSGRHHFDAIRLVAMLFTGLTMAMVAAVFVFLLIGSVPALRREGMSFFLGNHWSYRREAFQALAMLYGTAAVSTIAMIIAVPVAFFTALFISEMCGERVRLALKMLVELLAGIPSVVYGLLGVLFLRSWMQSLFERYRIDALSGDTLLTAGVLLAVMILPTATTLFDDAFRAIGAKYRDAARATGLTRAETSLFVLVPQALPALGGALLLSLGRALGETIAVFLVVGRADNRTPHSVGFLSSLIQAGQTITSKLGGAETNIAVGSPLHSSALLTLALTLFVTVVGLTITADLLRSRVTRFRA